MRGTEVALRVVGGVMALGSTELLLWGFGSEAAVLLRLGGGFWWRVAALSAFPCGFWLWCGGLLVLGGAVGVVSVLLCLEKEKKPFLQPRGTR